MNEREFWKAVAAALGVETTVLNERDARRATVQGLQDLVGRVEALEAEEPTP